MSKKGQSVKVKMLSVKVRKGKKRSVSEGKKKKLVRKGQKVQSVKVGKGKKKKKTGQ